MILKNILLVAFLGLFNLSLFAQEGVEITTDPYVDALYNHCGNEIKIIIPVIFKEDSIRYICRGGEVLVNESDHRIVTLVPHSPHVLLNVYRGSTLIGVKKFKVRLIPKPTFKMYADSNLIENIDSKDGFPQSIHSA